MPPSLLLASLRKRPYLYKRLDTRPSRTKKIVGNAVTPFVRRGLAPSANVNMGEPAAGKEHDPLFRGGIKGGEG